jgi:hypothetical protein
MIDFINTLSQAVDSQQKSPSAQDTLTALLNAEKQSHSDKPQYQFEQFLGNWQLCFINGTNQSRSQFAHLLKDGFYLPPFIPIKITYSADQNNLNQGRIINTVTVGLVTFTLEGPCKFIEKKNILAFDFTYLTMFILGKKIYSQNIRGGQNSDEKFFPQSISKQAFFSYFLITDKFIAARGRGGGLALWKKIKPQ